MRGAARVVLLAAAAAWACGPSAAKDKDAGQGGGSVDGGGEACQLPPGSNVGHVVRVAYLVPSDREPRSDHVETLERALRHTQLWYRDHTNGGITFQVYRPPVTTFNLPNPESYYRENDSGGEERIWFWDNVLADAFEVSGGAFNEERSVWLYYVLADPGCGQLSGASSAGVALIDENDLRGLVQEPREPRCPDDEPDSYGRCRWVGGMAYLLGAAIGMENPPYLWDYPEVELEPPEQAFLEDSRFFEVRTLPASCPLDCTEP